MCLYIGKNKSFVAKEDIVVYKYVEKESDGYYTPCQRMAVKVNSVLSPKEENVKVNDLYNGKHSIEGGAIHACLTTINSGFDCICLKAYIKKGVEFWIQDDFKQIAAKELYITDEVIEGEFTTDVFSFIEEIIDSADGNSDGVKIGYYRLSNGRFVNPLNKDYTKDDIIGVVSYFIDNKPVCIATEFKKLPWLKSWFNNTASSDINDTVSDLNGYNHTKNILKSKDYDSKNFESVTYCANYTTNGTKKGDWYMPAIGECIMISQNLVFINASLKYGGFNEIPLDLIWSSSETKFGGSSFTWRCYLGDGYCCGSYYYKDCAEVVLPCLAFIDEAQA